MKKIQAIMVCLCAFIASKTDSAPQAATSSVLPKQSASKYISNLLSPVRTNKKQAVVIKNSKNNNLDMSTPPKTRLTDQQALDAFNTLSIPNDTQVAQEFQTLRKENLENQPVQKTSWLGSWANTKPKLSLSKSNLSLNEELNNIAIEKDTDTIDTASVSSDKSIDFAPNSPVNNSTTNQPIQSNSPSLFSRSMQALHNSLPSRSKTIAVDRNIGSQKTIAQTTTQKDLNVQDYFDSQIVAERQAQQKTAQTQSQGSSSPQKRALSPQEQAKEMIQQSKNQVAQRKAQREQAAKDIIRQQNQLDRQQIIGNRKNNVNSSTGNLSTQSI